MPEVEQPQLFFNRGEQTFLESDIKRLLKIWAIVKSTINEDQLISTVFLGAKKNGKFRVTLIFRYLTEFVVKDHI